MLERVLINNTNIADLIFPGIVTTNTKTNTLTFLELNSILSQYTQDDPLLYNVLVVKMNTLINVERYLFNQTLEHQNLLYL